MSDANKEATVNRPYSETEVTDFHAKCGGKRNVKEVIITDDEGVKYAYLVKRPTRSVVEASIVAAQNKEILKGNKLAMGCVLAGDMEIIEQDGVMYSELLARVKQIGKEVTSEIKNF